jgi:hypothetical protein
MKQDAAVHVGDRGYHVRGQADGREIFAARRAHRYNHDDIEPFIAAQMRLAGEAPQ